MTATGCVCDAQKGGPEFMAPGSHHRPGCPASGLRLTPIEVPPPVRKVQGMVSLEVEFTIDRDPSTLASVLIRRTSVEPHQTAVFLRSDAWLPIATAPRDGTRVDLWALWQGGGERWPDAYWGELPGDSTQSGWRDESCAVEMFGVVAVGWRPIPPPPKEGEL